MKKIFLITKDLRYLVNDFETKKEVLEFFLSEFHTQLEYDYYNRSSDVSIKCFSYGEGISASNFWKTFVVIRPFVIRVNQKGKDSSIG